MMAKRYWGITASHTHTCTIFHIRICMTINLRVFLYLLECVYATVVSIKVEQSHMEKTHSKFIWPKMKEKKTETFNIRKTWNSYALHASEEILCHKMSHEWECYFSFFLFFFLKSRTKKKVDRVKKRTHKCNRIVCVLTIMT